MSDYSLDPNCNGYIAELQQEIAEIKAALAEAQAEIERWRNNSDCNAQQASDYKSEIEQMKREEEEKK